MIAGSAGNTLISVTSTVLMIGDAHRGKGYGRQPPGHHGVDHGMSIIASCATRTGQARWLSCEVEEVERSISVF